MPGLKVENRTASQPIAEPGWTFWIAPSCLICLLTLLYVPLEWFERERNVRSQHEKLLREMNVLRGQIESTIFEEAARIHGIAAVIRANPDITQQQFASIADGIAGDNHRMRNLAAARDLVITHMYPIKGNEKAIGLSYRDSKSQWPAVKNAIDKSALIIAGPIDLVQGGTAFIGRVPIFLPASAETMSPRQSYKGQRLWGVLSSVIDIDVILSLARPFEDAGIEIALRGKDALGAQGAVFYGDPGLFDQASELMPVSLPYGSWEVGARIATPVVGNSLETWVLRSALLLVCFAIFLSFSFRYRTLLKQVDTARKAEQSERKYQALFEGARDAIFITDPDLQTIKDFNEIAAQRLGYERHELLEKPVSLIDEDSDLLAGALCERLHAEGPVLDQIETVHRKKNGDTMAVELTRSLVNIDGKDLVLSIARDITGRKRQELALKAAQERAETASLAKSAFLANMSHEIRTPMNGVLAMSELLLEDELTDRQRKKVETIYKSGNILMVILNDLLDLSKIEAGQLVLEEIEFELPDILQSSREFVHGEIDRKGLQFVLRDEGLLYSTLRGDPTRIIQVLTNLISNAVKFTKEGTVTLTVSQTETTQGVIMTHFEVTDTGIGIPDELLEKVFDKFSQADSSTTRQYGGTGLGLSICRTLTELMGGSIGCESRLGEGSRFWFTVPSTRWDLGANLAQAIN